MRVGLGYNEISNKGDLVYFYAPIVHEREIDEKEKAKKAANDL